MPEGISKELTAASATPLVLSVLEAGDSYGYAIIRRIRELSGGSLEWTEGMLYPVLHRIEEQGAVESYWSDPPGARRRKYYRLTSEGRALLEKLMEQWRLVDSTLNQSRRKGENDVQPEPRN